MHAAGFARAGVKRSALSATILCVAVAAILSGVALRFYHLNEHGFWGDEGVTALRVAGYGWSDVIRYADRPGGVPAGAFGRFRRAGPHGAPAVLHSLASEDPQHPPVYYELGYAWERATGSGALGLRVLSVLLSLLLIPAIFWLAFELFGSAAVAWIAAAIAAVSPFNLEYAQQAREYGLWAVMTCVSGALLLSALRNPGRLRWAAYGASVAAGLYTHTFFLLVLIAQIVYVAGCRRQFGPAAKRSFGWCALAGAAAYAPWFVLVANQYLHQSQFGTAGYHHQSINAIVYAWIVTLSLPVVDLEFASLSYFAIAAAVLAIEIAAIWLMIRRTAFTQWWFVVCLAACTLPLQLGNVGFTDNPRYLVPTLLALQIALAWLLYEAALGTRVSAPAIKALGAAAFAGVLLFAAYDDVVRADRRVWWANTYGEPLEPAAARIAESREPVVIYGWAPRDWESLYDEASFLPSRDRVSYDDSASAIARALANGDAVYVFSRFPFLARTLDGRFRLTALPVRVYPQGYALVARARHGTRFATSVTWLWSVTREGGRRARQ